MEKSMKEWALYYASLGLAVFPVKPHGKAPLTEHGCKDASWEEAQIERWWARWPSAGIGIATGEASGGLLVIDLDVDEEKGVDGRESLRRWEMAHGPLPGDTWLSITGRGGYHYFYQVNRETKNRAGLYEGVDVRGDGGYIVAPPSIHPSGRAYEWEQGPEDGPLAEADARVWAFLAGGDKSQRAEGQGGGQSFEAPEQIPEGQRVQTLVRLLCSQQAKGLSDGAIRAAVRAENEAKCVPPLTDAELEKEVFPALGRYQKGTAPYKAEYNSTTGSFKPGRGPIVLTTMDTVEEKTPEWLIPGYMPKNEICILAGDGGAGKTSIWCAIAAAVSSGSRSFLEQFETINPFTGTYREPGKVLFFSSEDSAEYTLKGRLRRAGARMDNVLYLDVRDEHFKDIKFDSPALEGLIAANAPALVIFDPIQSFTPPKVQMERRNDMRACMNPMIGWGKEYGVTFLIIVHTNKQTGAWGRKRIADSADIWDIARSVMIAGEAGGGLRYLSQEKCNVGPLSPTILYRLDGGGIVFDSTTDKRDREFMLEGQAARYQAPAREDAKDFILDYLKDGEKETAELDGMMKAQGISGETLKRAKAELRKDGKIIYTNRGYGKDKKYYCALASLGQSETVTQ